MNLPPLHEALLDEPLFEAVRWFREQQAQALQVQYLHQGVEWRDTLKRVPGGVRLVRMQIPSSQSMQRDG